MAGEEQKPRKKRTGGKASRAAPREPAVYNVERDEDGRVKSAAAVLNPTGKNGHLKGYQPYGKRALYYLERYTMDELRALVKDRAAMGRLSVYDNMILNNLADATASGMFRGQERERLLSRIEGQPKAVIELDAAVATQEVPHGENNPDFQSIRSGIMGLAARLGAGPEADGAGDEGAG